MKHLILIFPVLAIAGCTSPALQAPGAAPAPTLNATPPPPTTATTVEQFDTTSEAERAAAAAAETGGADAPLGVTVASLGPPTEPGIWLKTPLVDVLTEGRITFAGKSINVELRPSGGAAGAGSQISLAAMRLLDAPLTGLPEITVFAK
ncbi:D-galactarate dehydratase [Loktanella agnita]|uniref:D-galactarate dehydratase n=1 Tax=Loktanella agnita TaxID=287097 RepID=UPI003987F901